jgi:hypothetical protein
MDCLPNHTSNSKGKLESSTLEANWGIDTIFFFYIKYKKLYRSKSETKLETNRSDIQACTYKQAKGTCSFDQINATK